MAKFIGGTLILSGMIIGAGIFAVPFSFARSGFLLGAFELILLAGVVTIVHLLYAEVVLKTDAPHRLPGYAAFYLGRFASSLSWLSALFGISGTLLAYLLLGSQFLSLLFHEFFPGAGSPEWVMVFAGACGLVTFFPLRREAFINGVLTAFLIGFFLFLIARLAPFVERENLFLAYPREAFFPYGVILFAMSGALVIPDLITFLGRNRRRAARLAILAGSLIPAAITLIFAWAVVGVSGIHTTEDALSGLRAVAGESIITIGGVIGLLAVFTSYLMLTSSFQALLFLDFRIPEKTAWLLGIGIPFAGYIFGITDFIRVIAAVGAIAVGIDSGLILLLHERARGRVKKPFSALLAGKAVIYGMIILGIGYEIVKIIDF